MPVLSVEVDDETYQKVDANADHFDTSRSAIIRALIEAGFEHGYLENPQEYERKDCVALKKEGKI